MNTKGTILIVDDAPANLKLLMATLHREGYQVLSANSGELALASVAAGPPDLILLDMRMPGMDGFEVCRRLKANDETRDIPIIFISAFGESEDRVAGFKLEAVDCISKSVQNDELLARVQANVELRRLRVLSERHAADLWQANQQLQAEVAERKQAEAALRESETVIRKKLSAILEPEGDIASVNLADIIDIPALQSLMEDFYRIMNIGIGVGDLAGNALVAVGWQDICTKFHRVQPDTLKNCHESDVMLSIGAPFGTFKAYRCKNNLWDMVTPIEVNGNHLGNIYLGQFFYDDEIPDPELFRNQARRYGFNETEYLAALDRVPRFSRQAVEVAMSFCAKLAGMLSSLSYTGIMLSRTLAQKSKAEEASRQSKEKLSSILLSMIDAVYSVDAKSFSLLQTNDAIAQIFGRPKEDFYANPGLYAEMVHPADKPIVIASAKEIFENKSGEWIYRIVRPDGETRWVSDRSKLIFDEKGIATRIDCIFTDITERKQAEEALRESEFKYRALIESSSDAIFCVDEKGEYKFTNQLFASTFGKTPEYFIGKTFWDIYPKEHADYRYETVKRVFQTGKSESLEVEVPLPDQTLYFLATANPIKDESGKVVLSLTHAANITKLKQAEAEREKYEVQNRQLQKTESLGRMAGAIAHHFNNQLHTVMGNLEMAMDSLPLGSDTLNTISEAMKASRKAAEVSSLMLTYLGQTPGRPIPLDLSETCRKSLILLQAASPKGMLFNVDLPASGPVILADVGQIQQVLTNLVTNAWEANPEKTGAVDLTVKTVPGATLSALSRFPIDWQPQRIPYACLEVRDTGCGIADKDIEKIFDPFFTTKFTGRGLGLSVVMGIVKTHGGGITVESKPDRGLIFRVFIPVSAEEIGIDNGVVELAHTPASEPRLSGGENADGGTVLVVEDEEQVRKMVKAMLTRLGYAVIEAKDGVEAVEIFKQHPDEIGCVLSDLTMPRMDGWETLAALRKLSPDIPVILSSGYDEAHVMADEHHERPDAFMGKPYQLKGLGDTMRRIMTNKAVKG